MVEHPRLGMHPLPEQGEEIVELEATDASQLELEQRRLAGVGVHRVDAAGPRQGIIEHVAPGAGDHHQGILGTQVEGHAVHRRILPAGVVDQRAGIDGVEDRVVDAVANGQG